MTKIPITINIDSTILNTAVAALNWKANYQATIPDPANPGQMITNPITPQANAKMTLITHIQNVMADYANVQAQAALVPVDGSLFT